MARDRLRSLSTRADRVFTFSSAPKRRYGMDLGSWRQGRAPTRPIDGKEGTELRSLQDKGDRAAPGTLRHRFSCPGRPLAARLTTTRQAQLRGGSALLHGESARRHEG